MVFAMIRACSRSSATSARSSSFSCSRRTIEAAIEYLGEASGLEDLKERWGRIPKPVQAEKKVIAAKDKAKDRLSEINDEIPY